MGGTSERLCYTDDWKRTRPDRVVYLPRTPRGSDGYGDHLLVDRTPGGDLLAMWTQSRFEGSPDTRVVYSRSELRGTAGPRLSCWLARPKRVASQRAGTRRCLALR